jgi:hypothetical protein
VAAHSGSHVLALTCDGITCVVNFGEPPVPVREDWGTAVLSSMSLDDDLLPGDAAVWLAPAIDVVASGPGVDASAEVQDVPLQQRC